MNADAGKRISSDLDFLVSIFNALHTRHIRICISLIHRYVSISVAIGIAQLTTLQLELSYKSRVLIEQGSSMEYVTRERGDDMWVSH